MKKVILILTISTYLVYSQPNDSNFWELTNGPFGQKITTIDVLNNDSVLVGTDGAGLFLYTKPDSSWENIYSDSRFNSIYSLIITLTNDILISVHSSTGSGIVKVSNDYSNWDFIRGLVVGKFAVIGDSSQSFIIFITQWNGIYKSIDNGDTWTNMNLDSELFGIGLKDVKYDSTLNRIIIASNGTIYDNFLPKLNNLRNGILFSDDYGQSYYNVLEGNFDKILINGKGLILAITSGIKYRSLNSGVNWEEVSCQNYCSMQDIIISTDSILYDIRRDGFYKSFDYGTTWELINSDIKDLTIINTMDDTTFYIGSSTV